MVFKKAGETNKDKGRGAFTLPQSLHLFTHSVFSCTQPSSGTEGTCMRDQMNSYFNIVTGGHPT